MAIMITGGAGYVGSYVARTLAERGERVVTVDNLSTGYREAASGELYVMDIRDTFSLSRLIRERAVDAVLHFAAKSLVAESMNAPERYYDNNVGGTLSLLSAMQDAGVSRIVFSSTAAVYGESDRLPITEDMPTNPTNVYGRTKLIIENILRDFDMAYGMKSISLRYFNVAGAHPSGEIGEAHDPETHLIPNILRHLLSPDKPFVLTGTDFDTRDGTCVRDYIEIGDLSEAHLLALEALRNGHGTDSYNLGSGDGFTVREVVEAAEQVTGRKAAIKEEARRPGDPASLIASSERFIRETGWQRKNTNLRAIIQGAWKWHSAHPQGYL